MICASVLTGVFQSLHILFANDMAGLWPGPANRSPIFGGKTPIAAMIEGGSQ